MQTRARLRPDRWRRRGKLRAWRLALVAAAFILACTLAIVFITRARRLHALPVPIVAPARHYAKTSWLKSGAPWTSGQVAGLRTAISPLANDAAFPSTTGMIVLDGRDGRVLYARNARQPLAPGSTIKLLTAAAALSALGPDYRFTTSIVAGGPIDDANLHGGLWLVGGGDPELTSDDLRAGVRQLQRQGLTAVTGDIAADGSRYGRDQVSPSWQSDDLQYGWAAPASALSIDGGSVQFTITPHAGGQAAVDVDPPGNKVIASVDTASADADNTLRIDGMPGGGYSVRGQIPDGAPQKYWRAVPDPTHAAAVSLLSMMRLAGVDVSGGAVVADAPAPSATLWRHESRPLVPIIRHMFFLSDNHYAEQLLREVGWKASGLGDLHNSLAAERAFMQAQGIPTQSAVLADGSGLSAQSRISAAALGQTLRFLLDRPLPIPPFALLPRAGIEGTVHVRDLDASAKGRVFAKDGYIEGASAIAGYVLSAHHGPLIFVFMVNDWEHGLDAVWTDEDKMLDVLSGS